jgi:hypothetical protein
MARRSFFVACTIGFSLAIAPIAGADPILITGGSVVVPGSTGGQVRAPVDLSGTRGFSMTGFTVPAENHLGPNCFFCEPGSTVQLTGAIFGSSGIGGALTLERNSYRLPLSEEGDPIFFLPFTAQTLLLPPLDDETLLLAAPFSASGFFQTPVVVDQPFAEQIPILGRGVTRLSFVRSPASGSDPAAWKLESTTYEFSDASVVAEPASLTLLGLGLAAGLVSRRGRRARR